MSVYIDRLAHRGFKSRGVPTMTAHLTASTDAELHEFARAIGLPKSWCHYGSQPHYDITSKFVRAAVDRGAMDGIAKRKRKPVVTRESSTPTPYAVRCYGYDFDDPKSACNAGQPIFLTAEEYNRQLSNSDARWKCPRCNCEAGFDDEIYSNRHRAKRKNAR